MNFANTLFGLPTLLSIAGIASAILSLVIWWIIRERKKKIAMPILRLVTIHEQRLPRIVFKKPPILPFLCFLLATICFLLWCFQPTIAEFTKHDPKQLRVHVYIDMSPSVSARIDIPALETLAEQVRMQHADAARLTFSTSHGSAVYDSTGQDLWSSTIRSLGFHRYGVVLTTSIARILNQTGNIDKLVIISDRDAHTWSGFSWQAIDQDTNVVWQDVSVALGPKQVSNVYFQDAKKTISSTPNEARWIVEIVRSTLTGNQSGMLVASSQGRTLTRVPWTFSGPTVRGISITASWRNAPQIGDSQVEVIEWDIEPGPDDAVAMDNKYRSWSEVQSQWTIISDPTGEYPVDDPAEKLKTALEVLGRRVVRIDSPVIQESNTDVTAQKKSRDTGNGVILLGGSGQDFHHFCPKATTRSNVWIVPTGETADFSQLCQCVSQLANVSLDCKLVTSRESYATQLIASSFSPISNTSGTDSLSLAYSKREKSALSDQRVTAFLFPLWPGTGPINHGNFTTVISKLLAQQWSDEDSMESSFLNEWPRIDDIDSYATQSQTPKILESRKVSRNDSNVPWRESTLDEMSEDELPPRNHASSLLFQNRKLQRVDSNDPTLWLVIILGGSILSLLIEIFWNVKDKFRFNNKTSPANLALWIILSVSVGLTCLNQSIMAHQIEFVVAGQKTNTQRTFSQIAQELRSKTTVPLSSTSRYVLANDKFSFFEPWLWIERLFPFTQNDRQAELLSWIKRGGFLVVSNPNTDAEKMAVSTLEQLKASSPTYKGWRSVSPDHELMRSFYLLEALPACNGRSWKWLDFDNRTAAIIVPYDLLSNISDQAKKPDCKESIDTEYQRRIMVNLLMLVLTTDYKKDQIHLPEILKRIRGQE